MIRIGRKKGERIVIYVNGPLIAKQLGNGQVEVMVKKLRSEESGKVVFAISAIKGVQIGRGKPLALAEVD